MAEPKAHAKGQPVSPVAAGGGTGGVNRDHGRRGVGLEWRGPHPARYARPRGFNSQNAAIGNGTCGQAMTGAGGGIAKGIADAELPPGPLARHTTTACRHRWP
jgi:hypothetical protein